MPSISEMIILVIKYEDDNYLCHSQTLSALTIGKLAISNSKIYLASQHIDWWIDTGANIHVSANILYFT